MASITSLKHHAPQGEYRAVWYRLGLSRGPSWSCWVPGGMASDDRVCVFGEAGERTCEWCGPLLPHHQHIRRSEHAKELRASCPSTASAKPRGAAILAGGGWAGWAAWTACRACGRMDGGRPCVAGPAGTVAYVARPRWGRGVGPPLGAARGAAGGGLFPPSFP